LVSGHHRQWHCFTAGTLTSSAGGGNVSNTGTPVAGQLASWTGSQNIQGIDVAFAHGRFEYVSATQCKFAPYNGGVIKINGSLFAIPSAGIAGLANTSVFVNGTAAQNLVANTTYWVFAFSNAGVVTGDFRTAATHGVSSAARNTGTEILTGDDTRTLIGMVRTNASAQFQNDEANRLVISWFNRINLSLVGAIVASASNATTSIVELSTAGRVNFLTWAGEAVHGSCGGLVQCSNLGSTSNWNVAMDGTNWVQQQSSGQSHYAANSFVAVNVAGVVSPPPSEGFHYLTLMGWRGGAAATCTFNYSVAGMIRG
jgi:hypothetical protein